MVSDTGIEPAPSCSQSKRTTFIPIRDVGAPIRICAELSRLQGGYIAIYVLRERASLDEKDL